MALAGLSSELAVRGPVDPRTGWLLDFADLKKAIDPIVSRLDHYLLNEIEGLDNPTSELVAIWIWNQLIAALPQLHRVTLEETCSSRCHYYGPGTGGNGDPVILSREDGEGSQGAKK